VELERELAGFRLVLTMTDDPDWDGESRKIDAQFFEEYLEGDLNQYTFRVAGPPGMTEAMEKALGAAGVKEENVIAEGYTGY
jgi:Na+-transporting NADH:ubiquinone oxidoreductase subunit NqrF